MENENTYTEAECMLLLQKILREYPKFLKAYMPNGWRKSECVKFFHPTAEQQFEEDKIITKNLKRWSKSEIEEKENLLSDFEQDLSDVNENKESQTLLGLCLWDIFSNNHAVKDANGKEYDLGSFRGSAAVITT